MNISQTRAIESARGKTTVQDIFVGDVEDVLTTAGLVVGEYDMREGYTISVVGDKSDTQWATAAEPVDLAEMQ